MTSSEFFSNSEKMNIDNSSFSNVGQDQINNDYRVYNTHSEENYGGSGHFINHGRDQNVNAGKGNFIVGERVVTPPMQKSLEQKGGRPWGGNRISHSQDNERKNPFRSLGHPTPRRTRTDTEILQWMRAKLKEGKQPALLELRGERAEWALEDMQRASYSPECEPSLKDSILNVMNQLSEASGRYVHCYYNPKVQRLGDTQFSTGGLFTDLWKGRIEDNPHVGIVALKVVKPVFTSETGEKLKLHLQQINKLRTLDHPNVMPFIGAFYFGTNPQEICFVSPWMEKGNLVEYLQNNRTDSSKRFQFAWGVANGLSYLHSLNVVHGDLKPHNVLIASNEVACLSDVGLYTLEPDDLREKSTSWCAPEVLTEGSLTQSSDIYAYGSVCYQIFAQRIPSRDLSEDELYNAIMDQEWQSECRSEINVFMLWEVITRCWSADVSSRPDATELIKILEETASISSPRNAKVNEPLFLAVLLLGLALLVFFVMR